MAMKYSKEFKDSIIAKLLPPSSASVLDVARETGIPKDTLYCWREKYRNTSAGESDQRQQSGNFSSEEKLTIVIETASLNETETSEYCRRKGLYPDQINGWTSVIKQSLTHKPSVSRADRNTLQQLDKTIKQLQSELNRKDKALAEAAALLILEKKSIDLEQTRGRKIDPQERQEMISRIDEACTAGARLDKVCGIAGISHQTIQRYRLNDEVKSDGRKAAAARRTPANKITEECCQCCQQIELSGFKANKLSGFASVKMAAL